MRQSTSGVPVRTLRVDVVEGPDAGATALAEGETLVVGTAADAGLTLRDPTVSRYHLELEAQRDGVLLRDLGSTNGTFVGRMRAQAVTVPPATLITVGNTSLRVSEGESANVEILGGDALGSVRGTSPVMRRLMAQVQRLALAEVSVLLTGESGTGKELIARALHDLGPRATRPFVTVDCGSLSPTLVASELFGHERGAFTGADREHQGAFERAHGGTILLDEIGELPEKLQATLLGVLERRSFRRLGGRQEIPVDLRVVAATHRDLRADVNAGRFRLDLFYRLAPVTLKLPPLRERPDDIPLLVEHFFRECGYDEPVSDLISDAAMKVLLAHRWPGNVRELRNWVEATLAMGEAQEVGAVGLDASGIDGSDPIGALLDRPWKEARGALMGELERRYLTHLLERAGGNVSKASRMAKMDRSHLNDLLRRHGLR